MRKALIIGLIVCVLAVGGIGAAFATGMTFVDGSVGALSLGSGSVDKVDVDYIGYELDTGDNLSVEVDGVYISFVQDIVSQANSTVIFVSLRDVNGDELAYCVATVPASMTLLADDIYKLPIAIGSGVADPADVAVVKVTVAENSSYSTPPGHDQDYGKDAGIIVPPGTSIGP